MTLQLLGISYKTASIDEREKIALDKSMQEDFLKQAKTSFPGSEWLLVSTCNRVECYFALPFSANDELSSNALNPLDTALEWLHRRWLSNQQAYYHFQHLDVVRHFISMLCGLDSMVLGESQIVAQVKEAMQLATQSQTIGKQLHRLVHHALASSKHIRNKTAIGENATSVAATAVRLARSIFSDFTNLHVLLIGAGKTAELTAWHLREQGVTEITVLNHHLDKAKILADTWQGKSATLTELPALLPLADIVISATSSPDYILTNALVKEAIYKRRRPVYLIDLSVPRDIDPSIEELAQVYLYNIDDLEKVVAEGLQERKQAALAAEPMIDEAVLAYAEYQRQSKVRNTIVSLKEQSQVIEAQELQRAKQLLAQGKDAEAILHELSHRLSHKLLHQTFMMLKQSDDLVD